MSEYVLPKKICTTALAFVTVMACATSASAQSVQNKADSAAAMSASAATSQALQAQNPLTPLYSIINEYDRNPGWGPLRRTQDVLLVEPVIPLRLTPDYNLVSRWITPVVWQPAVAPTIDSEFGLGNIQPQFFFTPAHTGDGFVWALGANAWLPTATDKTLGINKWGGGPTAVALWIEGPLLTGVLAQNTWAGSHGSSLTGERVNQLLVKPFVFYNFSEGWYLASSPNITADWTVPDNKWTVPLGGGFGRVMPVGDVIVNARFEAYYNEAFGRAPGITNVGEWTAMFTLHFVLPNAPAASLF
jgi:hypothetical protein